MQASWRSLRGFTLHQDMSSEAEASDVASEPRSGCAGAPIRELPHALDHLGALVARVADRRLAVFVDYDGTLTPIVDRPEDAVISDGMREAVRALAQRCSVCVVSGRDRPVVQKLMGVDDLIVAGSHGFDIWSPGGEGIRRHAAEGFEELIRRVTELLRERTRSIAGALVEPKRSSVAVHYRLVDERDRPLVTAAVEETLAEHADALKLTPGKMVYELQPNIDWDKGKAVLHLLAALGLDRDDVAALYIGDDITDEHAFAAIAHRGVGIIVADPDDPEVRGRTTAAHFALRHPGEVRDLLAALARLELTGEPELAYDSFDPAEEGLRETLTSTGNGYICMRGAAEWESAGDVHYPGTYAHGVYNRETTVMGGRPVLNEDLVNLPNPLALNFRHTDEKMRAMGDVEIVAYKHEYDVRNAVVARRIRLRDEKGRETSLTSRRFVSMNRMHQAGLAWDLVAENWSGRIELVSAIDGRVLNHGVSRYRQLEGRHLDPQAPRIYQPDVIALKVRTRQSRIEIAEAARTRVFQGDRELAVDRTTFQTEDYIQQVLAFDVREREPVRIEKMIALYTSRDRGISEPLHNAGRSVTRYPRLDSALDDHARAWEELWDVCDIRVPGDRRVQYLLRLHISHILQVCSRMTAHHDAGLPARGLNGEAYRGHVFWDELYVFPFLNFRLPEITHSLLMYRYRRLGEARAAAAAAGYRGAMYPWQSGSDGQDETPQVHLNPLSGRWDPDLSHNQRHVNAALFYNIWQYYQATHDVDFLRDYGAEMMLEIARFWSSIAHFNPQRERWEIHGVMGPDEFHEKYPGATEGGLRNNVYTNVMVAWICQTAREVLELLPVTRRQALRRRAGLSDEDIATWEQMSRRMFVPFHADGILSQFEGYEDLMELDWDWYRSRHENIARLDRILRADGRDPDAYKIAKQADAVMLFFLFTDEQLRVIFERLGYPYGPDTRPRTIKYYDQRTSHGSTLSHITHAGVLATIDPESSWQRFLIALESDVSDIQGGTTKEGVHMGVMSGTLDLIQRAYLGTEIRDDVLRFDPRATHRIDGLSLLMQFRHTALHVALDHGELTIAALAEGARGTIRVGYRDDVRELSGGQRCAFTVST
jgi:trehalose-phosphatase